MTTTTARCMYTGIWSAILRSRHPIILQISPCLSFASTVAALMQRDAKLLTKYKSVGHASVQRLQKSEASSVQVS